MAATHNVDARNMLVKQGFSLTGVGFNGRVAGTVWSRKRACWRLLASPGESLFLATRPSHFGLQEMLANQHSRRHGKAFANRYKAG